MWQTPIGQWLNLTDFDWSMNYFNRFWLAIKYVLIGQWLNLTDFDWSMTQFDWLITESVLIGQQHNPGQPRWHKYQEQVNAIGWLVSSHFFRVCKCALPKNMRLFPRSQVEQAHASATWSVTWGGGKGPFQNVIVTGSLNEKVKCWSVLRWLYGS